MRCLAQWQAQAGVKIRPRLWNRTDPDRPRKCTSIMRPGRLSNPYVIGIDGNRAQVLEKFEAYARACRMDAIAALDDADLVCCCAPMPCHGDIILKIWDELHA